MQFIEQFSFISFTVGAKQFVFQNAVITNLHLARS